MGEPISPSADELEGLPEEGLAGLIAKGRAQGSLTTGDVFDALADDVEPSPASWTPSTPTSGPAASS